MNGSFWIFFIFDYIICTIISFLFIRYFANKKVPWYITTLSRLFIFANFLLIFTLPYEIIYYNLKQEQMDEEKKRNNIIINFTFFENISNKTNKTELEEDIDQLNGVLRINYGIIFWVLVSVENMLFYVIGYLESGEFNFFKKALDAIKKKLMFFLMPIIIGSILILIYEDLCGVAMFLFGCLPIAYVIVFLAISIVKIPRRMYIHSDYKLALEYYEFRANKKLKELNKNENNLKKIYAKCQNTFDYIQKIEKFLENLNKNKKNQKNLKEINLLNENILINENNNIHDNNIEENKDNQDKEKKKEEDDNETKEKINIKIEENENKEENGKKEENIKNIENKFDKIDGEKVEKDEEQEKKEEEKEKSKIEKDYKKHKSIIKCRKYIDIFNSYISEIMKKYKIDMADILNEKPIKSYNEIVSLNAQSKALDSDNERIKAQIKEIYQKWEFLKQLSNQDHLELNIVDNENDFNRSLKEENFISKKVYSQKKIKFYKKYNKHIYLSLMILSIIGGSLIALSELTFISPVNISIFGLIFKNMKNHIYIHFFCLLSSLLFFTYALLSFQKINIFGRSNIIFGQNTNSLGLLSFCHTFCFVTYPLSLNIIKLIFHKNVGDEIYATLEEYYIRDFDNSIFYKIIYYIPSFLIVVIIIYYFEFYKRICKKKKKTSFYIKDELREKYIEEGKEYLIKLNKSNFNSLEI